MADDATAQDIADDLEADTADENKPEIKQSSWPSIDQWQKIIQNAWEGGAVGGNVLARRDVVPPAQPPSGNVLGQALGGNTVQPAHIAQAPGPGQSFQGTVGNYTNATVRPLPVASAEMPTAGDPLTPVAKSLHNQTFGDLLDRFGYGDKKSWLTGLETKLDAGKPIEPQLQAFMAQQNPGVRSMAGDIVGPIRDKLTQQYPALKGGDPFTRLNTALIAPPAGPGRPGPNAAQYGSYINPQMQIQPNVLQAPQVAGGIDRSQYAHIADNPALVSRLAHMVQGEVGLGRDPVKERIELESAFNRAQVRGIPIEQALLSVAQDRGRGYYASDTYRGSPPTGERLNYFKDEILKPVLAGSDEGTKFLGSPVTGNASQLGFAGRRLDQGYYSAGKWYSGTPGVGEMFVTEKADAPGAQNLPRLASGQGPAQGTQPLPPEALSPKSLSQTPAPLVGGSPSIAPQGPLAPPPRPPSNLAPQPSNSVEGEPIAKNEPEKKPPDDKFERMASLLHNNQLDQPNLLLRAKLAEAMHPQNFLTPPTRGLDLGKALAKIRLPKGFRPNPVG